VLGWQREFLRGVYDVDPATGKRRYRRAYSTVPKKNGKSFLIGGLPLYHLTCEVDFEPRPLEAFGAASARDQAAIVFKAAEELLDANRELQQILRCIPSTARIVRRDGRGIYRVISAEGGQHDGKEPSLVIVDELHRWHTPRCETLYQVLTKGVISRKHPFIVEITTAGEEYACPLWEREHALAEQINAGAAPSGRFFVQIYSADKHRYQSEPEYWKSREARVDANPSHEDHGGFLTDEAIVVELDKAIADPAERPNYVRYHLNLMVNRGEEAAIDMDRWKENQDVDLRTWPEYDTELLIRKWGLLDRSCYVGVDLSATVDLTAVSFVFPPDEKQEWWTILPFVWVPEKQTARNKAVDYSEWIEQKWIEVCAGWEIRDDAVKERIDWGREMFDLREVCLDPWNARPLRQKLVDDGYTAIEIPQTFKFLSEPTKKLRAFYLNGKLRHGNNPVFNWAASCTSTQADKKDNVMFTKPDRDRTSKRIDPMAATVNALYRALVTVESEIGFVLLDS
jgi:phage terminase large subunit-like protein